MFQTLVDLQDPRGRQGCKSAHRRTQIGLQKWSRIKYVTPHGITVRSQLRQNMLGDCRLGLNQDQQDTTCRQQSVGRAGAYKDWVGVNKQPGRCFNPERVTKAPAHLERRMGMARVIASGPAVSEKVVAKIVLALPHR